MSEATHQLDAHHASQNNGLRRWRIAPTLRRAGLGLAGLAVLLLLWAWGAHALQSSVPLARELTPSKALVSLWQLLLDGGVFNDVLASLRRVGVSLGMALVIGVPIGILVGSSQYAEEGTSGVFQFIRMISPLSWMPIAVMIFGIGDDPIYFLLTVTAVWPIIINTVAGVKQLNPQWRELAQSLSATRTEVLFKVILPGIVGHVLTGTRIAIGIIWILLVPCEQIGVSAGLGYFIQDTRDRIAYSQLLGVVVLIGILGFILDTLARKLYQYWTHTD